MANDLDFQVYNLTVQNIVTLWKIDFSECISFDTSGILYLSAQKDGDANITYSGQSYEYVGMESGGFRSEINGQLPQPTVTIDKQALYSLSSYGAIRTAYRSQTGNVAMDWSGAKITRTRIQSTQLNDATKGNTDNYIVDQIARTSSTTIQLKLAVSATADRINGASVQSLGNNRCSLRYRIHNGSTFDYTNNSAGGCPYGNPTSPGDFSNVTDFGNLHYTQSDQSTTAPLDACSYTVKGCQLRFDPEELGLALPFTGKYKNVNNDVSQEPGSI